MSDYALGATEVLPRLEAGDSHATRPLISLIVPVWNDDELVVDLVSRLQVVPELAEWVVAAVQPGASLFEMHRQGMVRLISCDKPSRGRQMNAGAAEARGDDRGRHRQGPSHRACPSPARAQRDLIESDGMLRRRGMVGLGGEGTTLTLTLSQREREQTTSRLLASTIAR